MARAIPVDVFTCAVCNGEFNRYPSRNRGEYMTCSRTCAARAGNWKRAKLAYERVPQMSEPERAWLAAAIDGEGWIGYIDTYPRIVVANTSLDFLERCRGFTGGVGRIAERKRPTDKPHWKQAWTWTVDGYPALAVLERIVDWLVIKQDKAIAAMATRMDSISKLALVPRWEG